VEGPLGLRVLREFVAESRQGLTAEREVGAPVSSREKARDDNPLETKSGHRVTDALLAIGNDRMNHFAKLLERPSPLRAYHFEIFVNTSWNPPHRPPATSSMAPVQ
jgi:hypothetical protein